LRWAVPLLLFVMVLLLWEWAVRAYAIPHFILPSPSRIGETLVTDFPTLWRSLLVTLTTTAQGLILALIGGVGLAILFAQSRMVEYALYPYAVILQVTPVIAIAPLLLIYMPQTAAVLTCAWIVAFFPILTNTAQGLKSADHNLQDLFDLYGATAWQKLWHLKLKAALPYFLTGLQIGGGLALIGAVVAEIAAGSAGAGSGLAYRIVESQYRLNIPRMFAALTLLSLSGVVIFLLLSWFSRSLLKSWHESARDRER
jgi:NitT/TauT family transport system permease protein